MFTRRGLLTGLISLIAAPAIVRASSLDVIRGIPLESVQDYVHRELAHGYVITRKAVEEMIAGREWLDHIVSNKGLVIEEQRDLDVFHVSGPKNLIMRSWQLAAGNDKLA